MRFHHNQITHIFIQIMHSTVYHSKTFKKVNIIIMKKIKKNRLYHFENISIHNFLKHHKQDYEIDHK